MGFVSGVSRPRRSRSIAALFAAVIVGMPFVTALVTAWCGCSSASESGPKTVKQLLEENSTVLTDLASYESRVRNDAVARIKQLGREQGTALTLHLLLNPQLEEYRIEIVLARILASWHDRRAIPYLLQFLNHPDSGAVKNALEGLLEFGAEPEIVEALEEMLARDVVRERRTAAETLAKMDDDEVMEICVRRFRLEEDHRVRATLLVAITNSRIPERKRLLIDALDDPYEDIRWLAWGGLQDYEDLPAIDYSPKASPTTDKANREKNRRVLALWEDGVRR